MNDTSLNLASLEVEENDLVIKILATTIWIILEFPCNAMLFGLVQFERIGGDPLKRRITDQVQVFVKRKKFNEIMYHIFQLFSNLILNVIASNIAESINSIQIIFDLDYPSILNYFYYFQKMQLVFTFYLTMIEVCLLKYWLKFIRKKIIAMDDSFVGFGITLANVSLTSLFAVSKVFIGDFK